MRSRTRSRRREGEYKGIEETRQVTVSFHATQARSFEDKTKLSNFPHSSTQTQKSSLTINPSQPSPPKHPTMHTPTLITALLASLAWAQSQSQATSAPTPTTTQCVSTVTQHQPYGCTITNACKLRRRASTAKAAPSAQPSCKWGFLDTGLFVLGVGRRWWMRGLLLLWWLVLGLDRWWVGVVFWGWRGCDVVFFGVWGGAWSWPHCKIVRYGCERDSDPCTCSFRRSFPEFITLWMLLKAHDHISEYFE